MIVDDLELIYRNTRGRLREPETEEAFTRVCAYSAFNALPDEKSLYRNFDVKEQFMFYTDQEINDSHIEQFELATMALGKLIASRSTGIDGWPRKFLA